MPGLKGPPEATATPPRLAFRPPKHSPSAATTPTASTWSAGWRTPPPLLLPSPPKPPKWGEQASDIMSDDAHEQSLKNSDPGPRLLKLARGTILSGDSPNRALDYAIQASRWFESERVAGRGDRSLELAASLQAVGAIYCSMGRLEEAVPVLERAVEVVDAATGRDHALAATSGYMLLGDARSMMGELGRSISCYESGLKIQVEALGDTHPRVAETSRHLAEAYVQAMRFDEAETLCQKTLAIHREHSAPASLEEAVDRRLMALICEAKGAHESALEHLVLASMSMIAEGSHDTEVAAIDVSIGNIYLSLCRFEEAAFSYHKALTVLKSTNGDTHPSVAAVFTRLADLYYRTGKLRESMSYCQNAIKIYMKLGPGKMPDEVATGLTEISAIYEAVNGPEEGARLLWRAAKIMEDNPGGYHRSTIAGIEAQMGVMFYTVGRHWEARGSFESAVARLRACGESNSSFFAVLLNQMGLACLQLYRVEEAAALFEEARDVMEREFGACHKDTLRVCNNLAAAYDALGRVEDAIEILEHIVKVREEQLGTADPIVDEEKKRLTQLLREAGRSQSRKAKSLGNLFGSMSLGKRIEGSKRQSEIIISQP